MNNFKYKVGDEVWHTRGNHYIEPYNVGRGTIHSAQYIINRDNPNGFIQYAIECLFSGEMGHIYCGVKEEEIYPTRAALMEALEKG